MKRNYVKALTGKDKEQILPPCRTLHQLRENYQRQIFSGHPLIPIGVGKDGPIDLTQSERESHIHILGGIGQGKSKLLEHLIRHDIERLHSSKDGCGLCFLDGSEDGATMRQALSYCAQIGFEKVLVIDPLISIKNNKSPCINPFNTHPDHWNASVQYLVDAFTVVWKVRDESGTAFIKSYLTALFSLFHFVNLPLSDLVYFTEPPDDKNPVLLDYMAKRFEILTKAKAAIESETFPSRWRVAAKKYLGSIQNAYKSPTNFKNEAGSTARRLNSLANPDLQLFFSHREGVDFYKLISDGWVILVNLDPDGLGTIEARLLGTILINKIIHSIKIVRRHGFTKPYYLYIDEAGDYVTYTLADILSKKRKIGLRTVLAHQNLGQLDNDYIRHAIINHTDIKCAFYISNQEEREKVFRMLGYGGDLKPEDVSFNMNSQKKQDMVIKLSKDRPKVVTVPFVEKATGEIEPFIHKLFTHEWYKSQKDISNDRRNRLGQDSVRSTRATKPHNGSSSSGAKRKTRHSPEDPQKDVGKKAGRADPDAQHDMAWESLFLEDKGDKS